MPVKRQLLESDWRVYYAIQRWERDHLYPPTLAELCISMGLHPVTARSAVRYRVRKLEELGYLVMDDCVHRTIKLVPEMQPEEAWV